MIADEQWDITWLSLGFAFVGGYSDASSFILAKTFTGHVTGNFVFTAISLAGHDWPICFRRVLAIALFLMGIVLSVTLEQVLARKLSKSLLPVVMSLEIVLITMAFFALTSQLAPRLELFVIFMALALGLQNGAWRKAGGISVHSTYVTGMITNVLATGTKRYMSQAARDSGSDPTISLICGIWFAFISGAALGAALVFRFEALGILGAALVLLALLIRQSVTPWRRRPASSPRP